MQVRNVRSPRLRASTLSVSQPEAQRHRQPSCYHLQGVLRHFLGPVTDEIFSALLLSHHAHLCPLPGRLEDLTCWQYKIGTRHSASLSVHRHSCYPSPIFSNKSFVVFFYSVVGLIGKRRVSGAVHFLSGWDCEIGDNLHFG